VEGPLVDRALAEEGGGDASLAKQLARHPSADRERQAGADDRVRTEHPARGVGDVHRAALAVADALAAGEQLGHHPVDLHAAGEAVTVAAVGGGHVVALRQRGADAGGDRLLAERGVDEAGDLAVAVELGDARLEGPDQGHRRVQISLGDLPGGRLLRRPLSAHCCAKLCQIVRSLQGEEFLIDAGVDGL
jgi:hypothetical protein